MRTFDYSRPTFFEPEFHPWLHWIAVLTAVATFPLIFMGGLVTSHQAGMSVPDWPNSFGYNMFLFPPNQWIGGILYEHTHRLMGTVVGFLAITLVLQAWAPGQSLINGRRILAGCLALVAMLLSAILLLIGAPLFGNLGATLERVAPHVVIGLCSLLAVGVIGYFSRVREERQWVRWLTVAGLIAVMVQGALGGFRVRLVMLDLAIVHACVAQAYFCLTVFTVLVTSKWWLNTSNLSADEDAVAGRKIVKYAIVAVGVVYLQLVIGAIMRHYRAGLAVPGVSIYGHWLPPFTSSRLAEINSIRAWNMNLEPVTLAQIWVHILHRLGAMLVSASLVWLIVQIVRFRGCSRLFPQAMLLAILLVLQLTLGVLVVYCGKPADVTSLHVAVGALVLVCTFTIAVQAMRLYSLRFRPARPVAKAAGFAASTTRIPV